MEFIRFMLNVTTSERAVARIVLLMLFIFLSIGLLASFMPKLLLGLVGTFLVFIVLYLFYMAFWPINGDK